MNWVWLFFASLAVVGSIAYNLSVKVAGEHINPFVFTVFLTLFGLVGHLVCLGVYKWHMGESAVLHLDKTGLWMALIAGLGIVIIDLGFFFAVKEGGMVASTGFWVIGSLALTALAGIFVFHEALSVAKVAGVALGVASLYLLTRP